MSDSWTYWQREQAGQSDHGVTGPRVLLVFGAVALAGILWLGPKGGASSPPTEGSGEPRQGAVTNSACAELARLEAKGIRSGPAWWDVQPECKASLSERHRTRP